MTEQVNPIGVLDRPMAKKKPMKAEKKITVVSLKGTPEWRDWLQEGAEQCRTDVAKLMDAAVIEYLVKRGFTKSPPKR